MIVKNVGRVSKRSLKIGGRSIRVVVRTILTVLAERTFSLSFRKVNIYIYIGIKSSTVQKLSAFSFRLSQSFNIYTGKKSKFQYLYT